MGLREQAALMLSADLHEVAKHVKEARAQLSAAPESARTRFTTRAEVELDAALDLLLGKGRAK